MDGSVIKGEDSLQGALREEVSVEDTILMDNLHLIDEDGYLIRAAMLAFYKDPEKWVTGSYIKIGYFGKSDSDLVYQDEVHGPLIEQVDKTVDLVYTKYMKALIDYEGVQRIEQFMFHKDAFREILLNAIVHKDYSSYNPIQISVYEDKIYIWNDGEMPPNLDSTDKLFMKHSSKPFNPKLANVFFKSGMIEAWGRGFEKIREACALYDGPLPEYEINEAGIMVLCKACDRYLELIPAKKKVDSIISDERIMSGKMSELRKEPIVKIVNYLKDNEEITTAKGVEITGKSEAQVRRYLKVLW
ncbi:ATP-binding protein [Roseburia faecis]|uniref:ATP-binding protein n=1 Tax=Roseburia faecis TaxID=301302 RepID=UPI003F9755B4